MGRKVINGYPPFLRDLWGRISHFISANTYPIGGNRYVATYLLGCIILTYSTLDIFYQLNIHLTEFDKLPLFGIYQDVIVPFLAAPFKWVGLDLSNFAESLIAFSGVGASIWAGAEYREQTYLVLYPFKKWQHRPGDYTLDPKEWAKPPKLIKRPKTFSLQWFLRFPHTLIMTYLFLGMIVPFIAFRQSIFILTNFSIRLCSFLSGTWFHLRVRSADTAYKLAETESQKQLATEEYDDAIRCRNRIDKQWDWIGKPQPTSLDLVGLKAIYKTVRDDAGRIVALTLIALCLCLLLL